MDDPARKVQVESLRPLILAAILLGLVASPARAQDDDASREAARLDEISRLFGKGGSRDGLTAAVEKLGGQVVVSGWFESGKPIINVHLSNSKVTDADLASLKELLPDVDSLDLANTGITDAGLDHLRKLTKLHTLRVGGTKATDEGVGSLRRDLPQTSVYSRFNSVKYFPDRSTPSYRRVFIDDRWSEDLYAMKEPSLLTLSKEDDKAVGYRLYFWSSVSRPLAVRIVPNGDGAILQATQLDTLSVLGGKPKIQKSVKLTRDQWVGLKRRLDDAEFWSLPKDLMTRGGMDGAVFFVEGAEGGKYQIVTSNSSSNPDDRRRRFNAIGEEMIRLSGLDILKLWRLSTASQTRE